MKQKKTAKTYKCGRHGKKIFKYLNGVILPRTSAIMVYSKILTGFPSLLDGLLIDKNIITSTAVSTTPAQRGSVGNSRHKPIADPSNSARSVAMIATSAKT